MKNKAKKDRYGWNVIHGAKRSRRKFSRREIVFNQAESPIPFNGERIVFNQSESPIPFNGERIVFNQSESPPHASYPTYEPVLSGDDHWHYGDYVKFELKQVYDILYGRVISVFDNKLVINGFNALYYTVNNDKSIKINEDEYLHACKVKNSGNFIEMLS